jgi:hypothetical protein
MTELERIIAEYGIIEENAVSESDCDGLSEEISLGDKNEQCEI